MVMVARTQRAPRVLVVDDNRDAADTLAVLLSIWGYNCRVCYDGVSGLQTARDFRPECVLLDINMPGMDGYTVARCLRQEPDLSNLKMVALTAYSDKLHSQRIREAHFDHHVVKPADTDELERLLAVMDELLQLARQTKELARQNVALAG